MFLKCHVYFTTFSLETSRTKTHSRRSTQTTPARIRSWGGIGGEIWQIHLTTNDQQTKWQHKLNCRAFSWHFLPAVKTTGLSLASLVLVLLLLVFHLLNRNLWSHLTDLLMKYKLSGNIFLHFLKKKRKIKINFFEILIFRKQPSTQDKNISPL
jgi:hypothetical protein